MTKDDLLLQYPKPGVSSGSMRWTSSWSNHRVRIYPVVAGIGVYFDFARHVQTTPDGPSLRAACLSLVCVSPGTSNVLLEDILQPSQPFLRLVSSKWITSPNPLRYRHIGVVFYVSLGTWTFVKGFLDDRSFSLCPPDPPWANERVAIAFVLWSTTSQTTGFTAWTKAIVKLIHMPARRGR